MLLIDGVKYEPWIPPSEDEFEQVVKEHAKDIFGEHSIYFDRKEKLRSLSGIGCIPDGYVFMLKKPPEWHIVEIELSSHNPYEHVVPQITKFSKGIGNPSSQQGLVEALYVEVVKNPEFVTKVKERTAFSEVHQFLSVCVSKAPNIVIVVEKENPQLNEAVETLAQVVEFRTLVGKDGKHVHAFEPLAAELESEVGYWEFLSMLKREVNRIRPQLRVRKPTAHYCKIPIGHTNVHLEWNFKARQQKLGVELHLERDTHAENSSLLAKLEANRVKLENTIGERIVFQPLWGRNWSRAYVVQEAKDTPEFAQWAVTTMLKFYDAFKPLLEEVDPLYRG